jgi:hypothetical protein
MTLSAHGLANLREAARRNHLGASRSEEARQKMRDAAAIRPRPDRTPVNAAAVSRAVMAVLRGASHRAAARASGVSLGALQRALKRMRQ